MKIDTSIFKTYDIRGVYPSQINPEIVKLIALGFVNEFNPKSVIVGRDARLGSEPAAEALIEALIENGVNVISIGLSSTPRLYFASAKYESEVGIMVTASHAPKDQTGFKFAIKGGPPTTQQIANIKKYAVEKGHYEAPPKLNTGKLTKRSVEKEYIKEIRNFAKVPLKPLKVIIDCGNSVNGPIARKTFEGLGLGSTSYLFEKVDGNFPNHGLNPKLAKNRLPLAQKIKDEKADLGIIWDGDGDRVYLLDQDGKVISPHFVSAIIGEYLIKNGKDKKMTIEVRTSKVVNDVIKKAGGEVITIKAWHTEIKYAMEKDPQIVFGSETSGHYVFRDFYKIDDGVLAALMFLNAVSASNKPLRKILAEFRSQYFVTEEINFSIPNNEKEIFNKLAEKYREAEKLWIDGVTITYPEWRFNLRASKTEPFIRLNLSANSKKLMEEKVREISDIILSMGGKPAES